MRLDETPIFRELRAEYAAGLGPIVRPGDGRHRWHDEPPTEPLTLPTRRTPVARHGADDGEHARASTA